MKPNEPTVPGVNESTARRGQYTYERLRAEIENHLIGPGERLRELEIAERMGVSRTPVREALKRLQAEGLITHAPDSGLVVTELTPQNVMQILRVREVLEGAAARFAAENASPLDIESLKRILGAKPPKTSDDAATRDRRFHDLLWSASNNAYLLSVMNALRNSLAILGKAKYATPGEMETFWTEHTEITDAIARRDPEAAEAAARKHIRTAINLRLHLMYGTEEKLSR